MSHSAVPSPTSTVQSKVIKDEYQNWLVVGHAFCLMNEGIRPYITREMNNVYNTLLALPHCVCAYDKTRKKNPWHDMTSCTWAKTLQGLHHAGKPKWNQSDSTKWLDPRIGCWEIAKLFMSDLGKHKSAVVDAQSTDVTGLMNILCWCKHFNTLRPYAEQVRNDRNTKWGHTPDLEISLADKNSVIKSITNLLNASVLSKDVDVQNALQQIKQINKDFDAQKLERKILLDFVSETKTAFDDVRVRLSQCEGRRSKDRKEIEGLERRLASYEDILKKSNQKIKDMETNWFLSLLFVMIQAAHELRKRSRTILLVLLLIISALQLDQNTYDDRCPSEDRPLAFHVKEFNFSRQLDTAREGFVGRKWLFKDVKSKLKNPNTSTVLIVGDPGSGKSAVAAHLICSRNSELTMNLHILAYHVCQHYNKETQEPGRFIRNLVDMIARRFPEYENIIVNKSLTERLRRHDCEGFPHECFEEAIVMPLKDIMKSKRPGRYSDDTYYIVLDALDECVPAHGGPVSTIVSLLKDKAHRLPKNIKIVATTRNDSSVIGDLKSFAAVVPIDPYDPRNEEDISFYIDSVPQRRLSFIDEIMKYFRFHSDELRMKESQYLVRMGQGNFLFVKLLAQYRKLDSGYTTTPKTIGEVYEGYFLRSYPTRESFKQVRSALEVLVSALRPFSRKDIFDVLVLQNNDLVYEYFIQDFNTLSHFLRYGENSAVSLFHKSLAEWLTSEENNYKGKFFIHREGGHKKLIPYYIKLIKDRDPNNTDISTFILDFAQHIARGDVYDRYVKVFHNLSSVVIKQSMAYNTSLLHLAATINSTDVIKLFLPYFQKNVDVIDSKGFTPAFISASLGFSNNLKLLVNHGANINHKTNPPPPPPFRNVEDPVVVSKREFWRSSMLHAAAQQGHFEIVKYLLDNDAETFETNGVGMSAIQLAAEYGHVNIVKLLHTNGAVADQLALHHAAMNGHKDVVEFLLNKGITDECMRCDGSFYWLEGKERYQSLWIDFDFEHSGSGLYENMTTTNSNEYFFQRAKAEKGKDYMLFDDHSLLFCETALHVSVAKSHVEVVRILLSRNSASLTCTDFTGKTPLHIAAAKNSLEILELLLDVGARASPKCSLIQEIELVDINDSMYFVKRHHDLSMKEEIDYFSDVCSCDHTPIDLAAAFGHVESARLLLHHDENLALKRDCNGASIIHIAACHGHHHFISWITDYIRDVHINYSSENGSTPLHSAAYCGKHDEVKKLISDGANTRALDKNNMTALHYTAFNSVSDQAISKLVCFRNVTESTEVFFTNTYVTAWEQKNEAGTGYGYILKFKYTSPKHCTFQQFVDMDNNCLAFKELLQKSSDFPGILNRKSSTGKTVLELAVINKMHCITLSILNKVKDAGEIREMVHELSYDLLRDKSRMLSFLLLLPVLDRTRLFQSAVANKRPDLMYFLHEKQKRFSSSFLKENFLKYLQSNKRSKAIEILFLDLEVTVDVECQKPFLESYLHLLSFWPPSDDLDNFFYTRQCNRDHSCYYLSGPLRAAIDAHRFGVQVLNRCRDLEGYTPLHRAAQGGNMFAIRYFLQLGADVTATTIDWNQTALELAVSYAGFPYTSTANGVDVGIASKVSILLLKKTSNVKIICDGSATKLTIYHIAAYRGMVGFVKKLLKNSEYFGLNVDCPDVNGITPLYLAKLNIGTELTEKTIDPWLEIAKLIESYGGKSIFPLSSEAEHHVLYRHLYGSSNFDVWINENYQELCEEMERMFSDHDKTTIQKCFKMNTKLSHLSNFSDIFQNYSDFLKKIPLKEKEAVDFVNILKLELTLVEFRKKKRLNKMFKNRAPSKVKHSNSADPENSPVITQENRITSIEHLIKRVHALKKILILSVKTVAQLKANMQNNFDIQKGIHRCFDFYIKEMQTILDRYNKFADKYSFIIHSLETTFRKDKEQYFCSKLTTLTNYFLLLLSVYQSSARSKDRFSIQLLNRQNLEFVISRSLFTAVPTGDGHINRDVNILVDGTRYLLDLARNKQTKYDYLRMLTLGWAPGTRLFYDNEMEQDRLERVLICQTTFMKKIRWELKRYSEMFKDKQDNLNSTSYPWKRASIVQCPRSFLNLWYLEQINQCLL